MRRVLLAVLVLVAAQTVWSAQAFACACCGSWMVTNVESWDVLNVRTGPSTRFRIAGTIPPETACIIRHDECRGKWCRISYADFSGWVNVRYLGWKP